MTGHLDNAILAHDQERPELRGGDRGMSFVRGREPELAGGSELENGHHRSARQCQGEDPVLQSLVFLRDILRRALQQAGNYARRLSPGGLGHSQASVRGHTLMLEKMAATIDRNMIFRMIKGFFPGGLQGMNHRVWSVVC